MKRVFFLFSAVLALAILPALAQEIQLSASIPFDFHVRGKRMPAGDYEVLRLSAAGSWALRDAAAGGGVAFLTIPESYTVGEPPKMVFHRYGADNFLAKICTGTAAVSLPMSKQEVVIQARSGRPAYVTLVPRLAKK